MEKMKKHVFGKDIYLLGADADGVRYWLEAASWDCGWYWGFGYVETYTNNTRPELSRDITSHQHYDGLVLKKGVSPEDFKKLFVETPLNDSEIWKLNELMETSYTLRRYSDMLHTGGAHITTNAASDIIKNDNEYKRINNEVLPAIFNEVYKILGGAQDEK